MSLLLGCVADDLTGATDLSLMLSRHGMPTRLFLGMPDVADTLSGATAVVIALKIRTAPADLAAGKAFRAASFLKAAGARQIYFKYCSTFDSTPAGNIGPVTSALMDLVGTDMTIIAPAFPETGRTVVNGVLFVDGVPLAESPMRYHPLTPMTESSLVRLMDDQTSSGSTAVLDLATLRQGAQAARDRLCTLREAGNRFVAVDCERNEDLQVVADACADLPLLTGSAGIAGAVPETLESIGLFDRQKAIRPLPVDDGFAAVLAGSCSAATQAQVAYMHRFASAWRIDPLEFDPGSENWRQTVGEIVEAAQESHVLVYSTTSVESLKRVQQALGAVEAADATERLLADAARRLRDAGLKKFIVAGGETSGAVGAALGLRELEVGPPIDPGVPWMLSPGKDPIAIAFKSGNFGAEDFFVRALGMFP